MIHPTAIVEDGARLGRDVAVGPFAIVEKGAVIGDETRIGPRVCIHGVCRIGKRNEIRDGAVLGGMPQSVGFDRDDTLLEVGDDNIIGEFVTFNRGTESTGTTRIGSGGYFMSCTHIGHDCRVADGVVMTSFSGLSGHCVVEEMAVLGGQAGAHQFVRIGTLAILGAGAGINQDLPPYMAAQGHPARVIGPNAVGLRRAGIGSERRDAIRKAYKIIWMKGLSVPNAIRRVREEVLATPEINHLIEFIEASERGILQ